MKFIINILFAMGVFITTQSYSDTFKSKRLEAVQDYKNGDIKLAFKKLRLLYKKGDRTDSERSEETITNIDQYI